MASFAMPQGVSIEQMLKAMSAAEPAPEEQPEPELKPEPKRPAKGKAES